MKLFTYRGIRVRAFYRHIRGITWFIWWFPSLLAIGNYCYLNLEEFEGFGEDHQQPEPIKPIEEEEALNTEANLRPLKEFAEEQDFKMATLRKIIYLLQEQGIVFKRTESPILVDPFQEELLLEILIHFEEGGRKSYPKAVEATLGHHGLGQGQGQA